MKQQTLFHADLYPDLSCVNGLNREFFYEKIYGFCADR